MWSRDVGRGVIEFARYGYAVGAKMICAYLLEHMTAEGYWGRVINSGDSTIEMDGNAALLLALYNTWLASEQDVALGRDYIAKTVGEIRQNICPVH